MVGRLFFDAAAAWWPFALETALVLGVTIAVIGALVFLLRNVAPEWRHLLWLGVLLKMAIPINLSHGWGILPSLGAFSASAGETAHVAQTVATGMVAGESAAPLESSWSIAPLIFGVWLGGVLMLSLAVAVRAAAARRMILRGRSAPPDLQHAAARMAQRAGLAKAPELRLVSNRQIATPAIWGVRRPVLVVPEGLFERCSDAQRDAILLHELVHLARRDHWTNAAQVLLRIVYFPHPLVWWTMRQIYRERELVCDDEVIRLTGDHTAYMRALLEAASFASTHKTRWALGVPFARHAGSLERRIEIMSKKRGVSAFHRIPLAARTLLVGAALLLPWTIAARAESPEPAAPQSPAPEVQGFVLLQLEISPSGAVTRAKVLEEFPPKRGLAKRAERMARKWKYAPQVDANGQPTTNSLTVRLPAQAIIRARPGSPPYSAPGTSPADVAPKPPDPPRPDSSKPLLAGLDGVTNPTLIEETRVMPKYPELARRARIEGRVYLQVVVDRAGYARDIVVLKEPAANLGFSEAAIDAVSQWRYEPATRNGVPVDVYITVYVTFTLKKDGDENEDGALGKNALGDPV